MTQLSLWQREPARVIHTVIAVLTIAGAVIGDITSALNGTETWVGVAIALANVAQGEYTRFHVRPVATSISQTDSAG